jgi:EGF-like domain
MKTHLASMNYEALAISICVLCALHAAWAGGCDQLNNCNGHGSCAGATAICTCNEGWGATSDVTLYRAPDCSARVCPSGPAWGDVPINSQTAHLTAECSNRGICNRATGVCGCFDGFDGDACQRTACINRCSGHGRCVSIGNMATEGNAVPISSTDYQYSGLEYTKTWDQDRQAY